MAYKKIRLKDSDGNILYPEVSGKSITNLGNNFSFDSHRYWTINLGTDGGLEDNYGYLFVKLSTDTSSGDPAGIEIGTDGGLRARVSMNHNVYISTQGYLSVKAQENKGISAGSAGNSGLYAKLGSGLQFDGLGNIAVKLGSGLTINSKGEIVLE